MRAARGLHSRKRIKDRMDKQDSLMEDRRLRKDNKVLLNLEALKRSKVKVGLWNKRQKLGCNKVHQKCSKKNLQRQTGCRNLQRSKGK